MTALRPAPMLSRWAERAPGSEGSRQTATKPARNVSDWMTSTEARPSLSSWPPTYMPPMPTSEVTMVMMVTARWMSKRATRARVDWRTGSESDWMPAISTPKVTTHQ